MSYLFIKNRFQREKFVCIFIKKNKKFKKPKKTPPKRNIFSGFFYVGFFFFLGGFLLPTLPGGGDAAHAAWLLAARVRPARRGDAPAQRDCVTR
jgi:hypothetical protein